MPPKKLCISGPGQSISTGPPVEPLLPDAPDLSVDLHNAAEVRRASVVLVVTSKFPVERFLLRFNRIMPMLTTPRRHHFQTAPEPLPHRSNMNREVSLPASLTYVRESEKVKRCRLRPTRFLGFGQGCSPKLHQPSLVRMQRQSVLLKSL